MRAGLACLQPLFKGPFYSQYPGEGLVLKEDTGILINNVTIVITYRVFVKRFLSDVCDNVVGNVSKYHSLKLRFRGSQRENTDSFRR